jgi:hypothetical protein
VAKQGYAALGAVWPLLVGWGANLGGTDMCASCSTCLNSSHSAPLTSVSTLRSCAISPRYEKHRDCARSMGYNGGPYHTPKTIYRAFLFAHMSAPPGFSPNRP